MSIRALVFFSFCFFPKYCGNNWGSYLMLRISFMSSPRVELSLSAPSLESCRESWRELDRAGEHVESWRESWRELESWRAGESWRELESWRLWLVKCKHFQGNSRVPRELSGWPNVSISKQKGTVRVAMSPPASGCVSKVPPGALWVAQM